MRATRGNRRRTIGAVLGAALIGLAPIDHGEAQSGGAFEIRRTTVDGGGGRSTGGAFEATGTIGQPDAGVASGGAFEFRGGFWAGPPAAGAGDGVFADSFE